MEIAELHSYQNPEWIAVNDIPEWILADGISEVNLTAGNTYFINNNSSNAFYFYVGSSKPSQEYQGSACGTLETLMHEQETGTLYIRVPVALNLVLTQKE